MITLKIRQTHARVYKQCERKYDLMVNHKLTKREKSIALSIGTAAHAGRAAWLKTWDTAQAILAAHDSLLAEVRNFPLLDKPHVDKECTYKPCLTCAKRIVSEMIAFYCQGFDARFPKDSIKVLAIELNFEYVLAHYEELELILTGTLDAAILFGPYFLNFEFKTTKKQLSQFFEQEHMSPQHRTYTLALQALFPEFTVYGTILDVIRKPGKTYAPECNHELIPVDGDEIAELKRDYIEQLKRIAESMTTDYYPPNWDSCHTINGKCEYWPICKSRFNPNVIQSQYAVIDDMKQLIEDEEQESTP